MIFRQWEGNRLPRRRLPESWRWLIKKRGNGKERPTLLFTRWLRMKSSQIAIRVRLQIHWSHRLLPARFLTLQKAISRLHVRPALRTAARLDRVALAF